MRSPPSIAACLSLVVFSYSVLGSLGCSDEPETTARPAEEPAPEVQEAEFPPYPLFDDGVLRRAPAGFDHLVPRLLPATGERFRNLVYEAMNVDLRGSRTDDGLYEDTGEEIAERWRIAAAGTRRTLVIRDALFSQQDHPTDHTPVSVMMPMSWVTLAVHRALEGERIFPVQAPPLDDDQAWAALDTPAALFGSFPPSETVHEEATKPRTVMAPQRLTVTNARRTIHMLAEASRRLVAAAETSPEAVAEAGAEAISESDRRYFGERLRREHVILVAVENPTAHERVDQARGFSPPRQRVSDEALQMTTIAVLRRRLRDGDIGIERVDLNRMSERRRMLTLLEALIPKGEHGEGESRAQTGAQQSQIWLYVHGEARTHPVEDAFTHIYGFRLQVENSSINAERLRLFIRPAVPVGGDDMAIALYRTSRRYRNHDLPMNLNISTSLLLRIFGDLAPMLQRLEETEAEL